VIVIPNLRIIYTKGALNIVMVWRRFACYIIE